MPAIHSLFTGNDRKIGFSIGMIQKEARVPHKAPTLATVDRCVLQQRTNTR